MKTYPVFPPCDSGITVISCSFVVPYSKAQLEKFEAQKMGDFNPELIPGLLEFVRDTKALNRAEKKLIENGLAQIQNENNA